MDENTRKAEIKNLEAKLAHLLEWMNRLKDASKIAPDVQQQIELVQWQLEVLKNTPEEAEEIPFNPPSAEKSYLYTKSVLPLIPNYDFRNMVNSTGGTVSSSSDYYNYVAHVGDLGTPKALEFSTKFTGLYQGIQQTQDRQTLVKEMIEKLKNPNTIERYEKSIKSFSIYKSGIGERESAAMAIRTLLDGVQGTLFERARKQPKENMTWGKMGSRLAKIVPDSENYIEFIRQSEVRSKLISRLSDIGKDREVGAATNLEFVWTQVLDHLYITLSLLGFKQAT
jgi:hypothetical protein